MYCVHRRITLQGKGYCVLYGYKFDCSKCKDFKADWNIKLGQLPKLLKPTKMIKKEGYK